LSNKEIREAYKSRLKENIQQIDSNIIFTQSYDSISGKIITVGKTEILDGPLFFVVEESATFQGGDLNTFRTYVWSNNIYPREAQEKKMSGKAIIQFVVATDGNIKNIKIIRSSGWEILDREAARVISSSPKWKPGRQGGKAVNQLFTMPVSFISQ
jgi:protein TonB